MIAATLIPANNPPITVPATSPAQNPRL